MAISASLLTNGNSGTNSSTVTTATFSPTPNALVLVAVSNKGSGAATADPTASGLGLTWLPIGTGPEVFGTGANWEKLTVFRSMATGSTTGTITFDSTDVSTEWHWRIYEFTGVDTRGSNGDFAIVQTEQNSANAQNSVSITLSAFEHPDNATYGAFGWTEPETGTVGSGFTGGSDNASEGAATLAQYKLSNDTTVDASWTTLSIWAGFAVEIRAGRPGQFFAKPSPELITNGGFDADTDWTKGTGWTISGGVASANDTTNRDLKQDIGAIPGNTYRVTYTILNYVKGNISVNIAGNSGGQTSANGTYVKDIVAGSAPTALGVLIIRGGGDHQFDVDNVSVKEVKTIAKPSTELVTNGGFDADTDWNKGTGWTISDGVATKSPGTQSNVSQTLGTVLGKRYRVTFTVSNYVAGIVRPFLGTVVGTNRTANGTYVEDITYTEGSDGISIQGTSTFEGDIDNVSVKEVKALIK